MCQLISLLLSPLCLHEPAFNRMWAAVKGIVRSFCFCSFFFFFKQKTAYEMCGRDWSSDVCSSDLNWRKSYPACGGTSNSPIDLESEDKREAPSWKWELTGWDTAVNWQVEDNKHSGSQYNNHNNNSNKHSHIMDIHVYSTAVSEILLLYFQWFLHLKYRMVKSAQRVETSVTAMTWSSFTFTGERTTRKAASIQYVGSPTHQRYDYRYRYQQQRGSSSYRYQSNPLLEL